MEYPIHVNYEYTSSTYRASQWLDNLPDLFAADFEVASIYTDKDKEFLKYKLEHYKLTFPEHRLLMQQYTSDGLSHPSLAYITHLSVAWSPKDAYVFICDSNGIRQLIYNFLVSTEKTQLWHNCLFDLGHVYFHTHKFPKSYIDTQLMAKSLLNDANSARDNTRLKSLMAYAYGDWAVSKDDFKLSEMYEEYMLRYSATDSCATFKLYQDILEDLGKWKI